jgi:hypothetical protein
MHAKEMVKWQDVISNAIDLLRKVRSLVLKYITKH